MNISKHYPNLFKSLRTLIIIFISIEILQFLLFMKAPSGYLRGWNITNVFLLIKFVVGCFIIPPLLFRVSTNNVIKSSAILVLMSFVLFLLLEMLSFLFVSLHVIEANKPTYRTFHKTTKPAPFYADVNKQWGLWRYADSSNHKSDCYNVMYRRNSVGAADIERERQSVRKRIVVLGDSFVDGYTTLDSNRMSNQAEKATGIPHLNFGCGSMGTIQYSLVYKHLAKTFSHDAVIVFTLPGNDFEDNEDIGEMIFYRPLLVGKYPNYTLTHNFNDITKSDAYPYNQMNGILYEPKLTTNQKIKARLLENTFMFNVIEKISSKINALPASTQKPSYFNTVNDVQWDKMRYSFEQIDKEANVSLKEGKRRKIIIVALPALHDLENRKIKNGPMLLSKKLTTLCENKGWGYIDVLEYFYAHSNNYKELYLSCDPHWSVKGHQLASEAILTNKRYQELIQSLR